MKLEMHIVCRSNVGKCINAATTVLNDAAMLRGKYEFPR